MLRYILFLVIIGTIFWNCEDEKSPVNSGYENTSVTKDTIYFKDLTTLFQNQCYHCHSESQYSFYALNLDSYENTMTGSQNGAIVNPYEPDESLLYTKCFGNHTSGERMPQDNLTYFDEHPEKLNLIYNWIHYGCLE
tara:strand:- start:704 stop:1114 length:411 start_codon:yes stop_codon:yes gene_type:complete